MASEATPAEVREAELAKVFRRMGKAARRGDSERFERLKAEHEALKAEHVRLSHEEQRAEARARWAVERAQEARVAPRGRWRLPRGFASPLAAQRAAQGLDRGPLLPDSRRPALAPWRRSHPMEEVLWRPGQ